MKKQQTTFHSIMRALAVVAVFTFSTGEKLQAESTLKNSSLFKDIKTAVPVSGTVVDVKNSPLMGATVVVAGTSNGAITDIDGKFSLDVESYPVTLKISFVGYTATTTVVSSGDPVTIILASGEDLDEFIVTGTRSLGRTKIDAPVPVDVIDITSITSKGGQVSITEIMNIVAPSFTSQSQTVSDGSDHIDPASLRGLGPDQVLVLINGKRRHNTSLLNVNGTVGSGSVGTDMNAIPAAAIKRIEVLRDGAAAQYGSDAIAGVINIVLKTNTDGLELAVTTGANMSSLGNHQEGGMDGEKFQLDANYGVAIGKKGGFVNITGSVATRNPALRNATNLEKLFDINNSAERLYKKQNPGNSVAQMTTTDYNNAISALPQAFRDAAANADHNVLDDLELAARGQTRSEYRFKVGTAKLREAKTFLNMAVPINDNTEVYAFGGLGSRQGLAYGFLREPHRPKANTAANPDGFLPGIQSDITDKSIAFGIRTKTAGWNVDLSNTYGSNTFGNTVVNSTNASLGAASPSVFDAGSFGFTQNTTNLDFSKYREDWLSGVNIAFGTEYRLEQFEIIAGAENSYATYNNGVATAPGQAGDTNVMGESLPGTSQVYGGFTPVNAISKKRNNIGGYGDVELNLTQDLLLALATRYESYSDFGNTFNYKAAARYKATKNIGLRGAYSTGFRAPSLHQQFFSRSSTIFDANGVAQEEGLFTNESRAAELLGIEKLKQETSQSMSVGVTAGFKNFTATIDAYSIAIEDRIVLSGAFTDGGDPELAALFKAANAGKARFLSNAIDTKTQGVDIVLSHKAGLANDMKLVNSLAATFSTNEVTAINVPETVSDAGINGDFFDAQEEAFLTLAQPRSKVSLINTLTFDNGFNIQLRNVYYGEVTDPDDFGGNARVEGTIVSADAMYDAKVITDLSLSYGLQSGLKLAIGANNLLDVYPTENRAGGQSNASFPYSRRTSQFGFTGRYMFVRAAYTLK
ncbi:TonB-dependent receptor [Bacteroidia bacterium]|nr:TonB-dependent receptor [Bacteroidia bacterium]MDB9882864.1 TonB-dependent receptor [Bacteroidia bacterium]MDC1395417.1 TonB-dependent receptor [Bacteroidia bacterium]